MAAKAKRWSADNTDAWNNESAEEAQRNALSVSRSYGRTMRGGRVRTKVARGASAERPSPYDAQRAQRAPLGARSVNAQPSASPVTKRRALDSESAYLCESATRAKRQKSSTRGWKTKARGVMWDHGVDEISADHPPVSPIDHAASRR